MEFRILVFILVLSFFSSLTAEDSTLDDWKKFSKTKTSESVINYIQCQAQAELSFKSCDLSLPDTPAFFGQLGVFITIVNKGKVRGCFGAFNHKNTKLANVIRDYIRGALKDDPRYPPLELEELKTSYFILTIADSPIPVVDIDSISLGKYGVFLGNQNGSGVVYVPGEIKSHSVLKRIIQKEKIQDVSVFKAILIR